MPVFAYRALDIEGRLVDGHIEGPSLDVAARELAAKGLTVQTLSAAQARSPEAPASQPPAPFSPTLTSQVGLADLSFFFRQLATMMAAGISPAQCFQTLAGQTRSPRLAAIIHEARQEVEAGRPMSDAFARHPEVFSNLNLGLLRAGEQGGFVDAALGHIADYIDQEIRLRRLLRRVTLYPKLVIGASIVLIVGANLLIGIIRPGATTLDTPLTRPATWIVLGPLIVAIWLFVKFGLKNQRIKTDFDDFVLRIPGLGTTSEQYAMAKFGRAFGALYRGGLPLRDAFRLAVDACGNEALRARMQPAIRDLDSGAGIADTFRATGAFNPIVLDMVATGEQTGNLDLMLNKMAEFYEGEAETRSHQAATILGIVCLIVPGIYVGYVYITNLANIVAGPLNEQLSGGE